MARRFPHISSQKGLLVMSSQIPTVDVAGLLEFLAACHAAKVPAMIYGPPGVGKSDIVEAFGASIGHAVLDVRLSYMLPETIGPIYYPDAKGRKTTPLKPAIVAQIEELHASSGKPVLVFLDEITTAPADVLKASLELLLKGAIAGFAPAAPFFIVAAGNRPEDTPDAIYMPVPTRTRFFSVLFRPTLSDLSAYLETTFPGPETDAIVSFLATPEARRMADASTAEDGIDPLFTPRGLAKAIHATLPYRVAGRKLSQFFDSGIVSTIFQSSVGAMFYGRMSAHIATIATLANAGDVLASPESADIPDDPTTLVAQLSAIERGVIEGGLNSETVAAFQIYLDRCPAEASQIWARNASARLMQAFAATMSGRRMLATWKISIGDAAAKAARQR
jgi:hypothetical protein